MHGASLTFQKPIRDAISRIRFAPQSNSLLVSSWDSSLRLYDADSSLLRLEAPCEAALLDCCFRGESQAFSAASDGCIRSYDLHSGAQSNVGNHDDVATCVGYSSETCLVISSGWDKKIMAWDSRLAKSLAFLRNMDNEVEAMSVSENNFVVAMGASVNSYDLRNLERPVDKKVSRMDVQMRCVSSIPYSRGYAVGSVDGRVAMEMSNPSTSIGTGYIFRCCPKGKDGRTHLVPVNDIAFNPLIPSTFVTGDNEGYVTIWDAQSKKRLLELPRFSSVASLSYNHTGQLLAVASSYTYQEATEKEHSPEIFIQKVDDSYIGSFSAGVVVGNDIISVMHGQQDSK